MRAASMPPPSETRARTEPDRLRRFVDARYNQLWRVVRRLGVAEERVEDAVQEVLIVMSRRLADVPEGSEWPFAFGTARRVASDARRRARRAPATESVETTRELVDPTTTGAGSANDDRRLLDQLLDRLSDDHREVVVLVELEGLTMAEAATLLAVPMGTIASRLRRAKARLEESAAELLAERPYGAPS